MAQDDVHLAKAIRHVCAAVRELNPNLSEAAMFDLDEAMRHTRVVLNRGKSAADPGYIDDTPIVPPHGGTGADE